MIFWLSVLIVSINVAKSETNLLTNGDFESTDYSPSVSDWYCMGPCSLASSSESMQGQYSVQITGRTARWNGLAQAVDFTGGERYKISAYVRLLNTANNAAYQTVGIMEKCSVAGQDVYTRIGQTPLMQPDLWYQVGGVRQVAEASEDCKIYVQTDAPADYLVDDASVTHIPVSAWTEWSSNTEERIDRIRKADINIQLVGPNSDSTILDIELEQTKMEFAMGSAVSASMIVDPEYTAYQEVFYRNFEWGVLENALKWRQMEWTQGNINEDRPLDAMDAMILKGIKMRCHCVLWGVDEKNPDWVIPLSGETLKTAVDARVDGVVNSTKGMCEEWDVNNEMLHGDFFEHNTSNPSFTSDMFGQVRSIDYKPRLFLNDFSVISGSDVTVAMKDIAVKYRAANVPIGGIGAQGHMKEIDIQLVKARLDIIAEAGLPVVITEFSVNEIDEYIKADKLTELLTLFFSHPAVDGVLLWGFWEGRIWEEDAVLFTGTNVTANAAGRAYQDLFHNTWRTHEFHTLLGNEVYTTRAFKDEYSLSIKYDGVTLKTQTFTLSDGGRDIQIHVQGNPGGAPTVTHVAEK